MAQKKNSLLERLRAKKQPQTPPAFVVVWYDNEGEWAKAKTLASDPASFEASYEEWRALVEASLAKYAQVGVHLHKLPVQAEALAEWCRQRNKPCDSSARSQYAAEISGQLQNANKL